MPDITMCKGEGCPAKELCYRYTAKPNEYRQSYFVEPPYKDDECDHFWVIDKTFKRKSLWESATKSTLDDNIHHKTQK